MKKIIWNLKKKIIIILFIIIIFLFLFFYTKNTNKIIMIKKWWYCYHYCIDEKYIIANDFIFFYDKKNILNTRIKLLKWNLDFLLKDIFFDKIKNTKLLEYDSFSLDWTDIDLYIYYNWKKVFIDYDTIEYELENKILKIIYKNRFINWWKSLFI